jgi:DNA-binding XRE family transcriptional regulator
MKIDQIRARQALMEIREIFGWTQRDMAQELLVSPGTIALWETGKRQISGPQAKLISMYHYFAKQYDIASLIGPTEVKFPEIFSNKAVLSQIERGKFRINKLERERLNDRRTRKGPN